MKKIEKIKKTEKAKKIKKSKKSFAVLFCVISLAAACQQDYETAHTVAVSGVISCQTDSDIGKFVTEDTLPVSDTPDKSITFCEENESYSGEFLSLYADYSKSELTTDIMHPDPAKDLMIRVRFVTDTSGDTVRLIARFCSGDEFVSEKAYTGTTLTDRTTDLSVPFEVPPECDGIVIAVQAKYETKKGGSRTDKVKFCLLRLDTAAETADETEAQTHEQDGQSGESDSLAYTAENDNGESGETDKTEDTLPVSDTPVKSITFCEENESYSGEFLSLYADYSKSELTTDIMHPDPAKDLTIRVRFVTDTSGDTVRLIARFCSGDEFVSEKAYTGTTLTGRTTDLSVPVEVPPECDGIVIAVQAKYETKKGGSRTDKVKFNKLRIDRVILPIADDDETEIRLPETDDQTADTVMPIPVIITDSAEVSDDTVSLISDNDTLSDDTDDVRDDLADQSDDANIESCGTDVSGDASAEWQRAELTGLRTEYSKCRKEMSGYIEATDDEILVGMMFCSDSSGDMVRMIVECYDIGYNNMLVSIVLPGMRSSAGEWLDYSKNAVLPVGTAYIRVCVEAKYETKKGGSQSDVITVIMH